MEWCSQPHNVCLHAHAAIRFLTKVPVMTINFAGAVLEVEGKVVSAARLYRAVGLRGGFDNVSKHDLWRSIGMSHWALLLRPGTAVAFR